MGAPSSAAAERMLLLSLLAACTSPSTPGVAPDVTPLGDTTAEEHPYANARSPDESHATEHGVGASVAPVLAATWEVNAEIGTVAVVRWATAAPSTGWVEVVEEGGEVRVFADTTLGTQHEILIVGLAAGTPFTWQALSDLEDGTRRESTPAQVLTAAAPSWLPALAATPAVPGQGPGGFVLSTVTGSSTGVFLLDDQGRYVWWWRPDDNRTACQARLARDGRSVLVMGQDEQFREDLGEFVRVDLEGNVLATTRAPMAHHDFIELADGRVAYLAVDTRTWEGEAIAGDRLVLLDLESGEQDELWSTWDSLTPPATIEDTHFYGFALDWTHANGLFRDEATGDWLVSLHSLDAIVRIDSSGAQRWQLGGVDSDFALTSGTGFVRQHSPSLTPGGLLLFDNVVQGDAHLYSEAVEYTLDEDAMTYAPRWTSGDDGLYVISRGSADRVVGNNTLISYGSSGRISLLGPDDALVFEVNVTDGRPLGFTHLVETLGEE